MTKSLCLVDDDPDVLDSLIDMATMVKVPVVTFSTAREAIAYFAINPPVDAYLVDRCPGNTTEDEEAVLKLYEIAVKNGSEEYFRILTGYDETPQGIPQDRLMQKAQGLEIKFIDSLAD